MPYSLKKIVRYTSTVCLFCVLFVAAAQADSLRETPIVKAVQKVGPAVVNISIDYEEVVSYNPHQDFFRGFGGFNDPFFDNFFQDFFEPRLENRQTLGSGVIIDGQKGLILTNAHVISIEGEIKITLQDGREFFAKVIGSDPDYDIAVLQLDTKETLPSVPMGDSSDLMVGETVIAIGNPFGFSNTVTTGIISSTDRSIRTEDKTFANLIQLDASINPGNSGGPLLNIHGELIGINTAIYAKAQGIGFAIPINLAQKITDDLITYGKVTQSWLGIIVQPVDKTLADYMNLGQAKALLVRMVEPESPAARAGIKTGDIIVYVNGKPMNTTEEYKLFEKNTRAGETVTLTILGENDKPKNISVKTVNFPDNVAPALAKRLLGFTIQPAAKGKTIVVSEIEPGSFMAQQGLRQGDVILGINNIATPTPEIYYETLIRFRQDSSVNLTIARGNRRYVVAVPLGS